MLIILNEYLKTTKIDIILKNILLVQE